jgi:enoyl-CoA hydratase/carnithine racemase
VSTQYSDLLVTEHDNGVIMAVINRPDRLNALSTNVKNDLVDLFHWADGSSEVRSVVLTGAGDRAFAAGQDLSEAKDFTPDVIDGWINSFHQLYSAVIECRKPTIAAINGYAVGAAFQLAMLCDLRIASDAARFGMP